MQRLLLVRTTHPLTHLVHRDRKRVHVRGKTVALASRKLWRLVKKSSLQRHRCVYVSNTRDAKISDLCSLGLAPNENVARLDVTMNDADSVKIQDSRRAFLLSVETSDGVSQCCETQEHHTFIECMRSCGNTV